MLTALVTELSLSDMTALNTECQRMGAEFERLKRAPSPAQLARAKQQWTAALLAWKRCQVFRTVPVVNTNALLRAVFWPVRPVAIDGVLKSSRKIDAALIEELGVDVKGMYALEVLLFGRSDAELLVALAEPAGAREAELILALAQNVSAYAHAAKAALKDGKSVASTFAQSGKDSMNQLVNAQIASLEGVVMRMQVVAERQALGTLKQADMEGGLSRISDQIALNQLTAVQRVYLGEHARGLGALVAAVSPSIHAHLQTLFLDTIGAVRALKGPLERAAGERPEVLEHAIVAVRMLEVAYKTELAGALGVTLELVAGDGD